MSEEYNCRLGGVCARELCHLVRSWRRCQHLIRTGAEKVERKRQRKRESPSIHWSFIVGSFLSYLAVSVFFLSAYYHIDPQRGYFSWVMYHPEHWLIAYMINMLALPFYVYGIVRWTKKR